MKYNVKKLGILAIIGLIFPLIVNNIHISRISQNASLENLKQSNGLSFIYIDGNWSATTIYDWCRGDGSWGNPYTIENVTIDASSSPTGSGIYIENSKNDYFLIRNCTVSYAGGGISDAGIKLVNTCNGTIFNNTVSYNENDGIYLNNYCDNNTISENIINDNNNNGIDLYQFCDLNNITGNTINSNNQHGIYLRTTCRNNNIINNTANNNDYAGIYLYQSCFLNNIINNTANNNDYAGIYLSSSSENNITKNTVNDNVMLGIKIYVSNENDVFDNIVNHNGVIGIDVDWNSDHNNIKNNIINRNDLGINLYYSDYNNISGNTLKDNNWCIYETYCTGNILEFNDCTPPLVNIPIFIDGDATGVGAHNWTWAESQTWCSGSGTDWDPYIIENLKISGFGSGNGIEIWDSNVSFIIQECSIYNSNTGIYLENVNNSRLINNNCSSIGMGIYIEYSINSLISGNTANGNDYEGITLNVCDFTNIIGNTASSNEDYGIRIDESTNIIISGNTANDNGIVGIFLDSSSENNILENIASGNYDGIFLEEDCYNNSITQNTIKDNKVGIDLYYSDFNSIIDNIAIDNSYSGISVEESNYNNFTGNILKNNTVYGMELETDSNNNSIYENFFLENGKHAIDDGTDNMWNSTIIGNYWDNHTGPDVSSPFGIVDTSYIYISGSTGSVDYLPIADDVEPSVIINTPSPSDVFGTEAPTYDVTITDTYLYETWYTLDGGVHNYTFAESTGNIDQLAWDTISDGIITLSFYASDKPGKIGTADVSIIKDTTGPIITVTSPAFDSEFGATAPSFMLTVTDDNLDSIWYSLDSGLTNYTITSNATINQAAWAALSEGSITITFYANDTAGNLSFEEVTITKDIPPSGIDPTTIIVIVVVSIVGGAAIIVGVYIFMKKRVTPE